MVLLKFNDYVESQSILFMAQFMLQLDNFILLYFLYALIFTTFRILTVNKDLLDHEPLKIGLYKLLELAHIQFFRLSCFPIFSGILKQP